MSLYPPKPDIPLGRYWHHDGEFYDVQLLARDPKTLAWRVVYRNARTGEGWVFDRPEEFLTHPDGTPRFTRVAP